MYAGVNCDETRYRLRVSTRAALFRAGDGLGPLPCSQLLDAGRTSAPSLIADRICAAQVPCSAPQTIEARAFIAGPSAVALLERAGAAGPQEPAFDSEALAECHIAF